jgi:hypothetical protein
MSPFRPNFVEVAHTTYKVEQVCCMFCISEYKAFVVVKIGRGKLKVLRKNLLQCHFIYYKMYMDCSGHGSRPLQ